MQEESSKISFIKNYEHEQLHKAIDKLPKVQRRRLILKYFYNLSIQQISLAEKVSKKVIERSLRRAEENLKKIVERKIHFRGYLFGILNALYIEEFFSSNEP